jgi:hypothetical protein
MHERGELEYPERGDIALVDVLQALGDPIRLQIVRILDEGDGAIACHEMGLPVSKPETAATTSGVLARPRTRRRRHPPATPSAHATSRPVSRPPDSVLSSGEHPV